MLDEYLYFKLIINPQQQSLDIEALLLEQLVRTNLRGGCSRRNRCLYYLLYWAWPRNLQD